MYHVAQKVTNAIYFGYKKDLSVSRSNQLPFLFRWFVQKGKRWAEKIVQWGRHFQKMSFLKIKRETTWWTNCFYPLVWISWWTPIIFPKSWLPVKIFLQEIYYLPENLKRWRRGQETWNVQDPVLGDHPFARHTTHDSLASPGLVTWKTLLLKISYEWSEVRSSHFTHAQSCLCTSVWDFFFFTPLLWLDWFSVS